MRIDIRGDKVKVTDAIKSYVNEKIGRLDRYFENPVEMKAYVVIRVRNKDEIIEVTVPSSKFTLRAEVSDNDLYAAIDKVSDKLERQIRKNKTRLRKQFKEVLKFEMENEEVEENDSIVVKRKQVELRPMSEEEAILQMELVDHNFYLFKNSETDKISVLYKRSDDSYGIIEEN